MTDFIRTSQTIERVYYKLSREALRRAIEDYMDSKHNVILPAGWITQPLSEGGDADAFVIVAEYAQ